MGMGGTKSFGFSISNLFTKNSIFSTKTFTTESYNIYVLHINIIYILSLLSIKMFLNPAPVNCTSNLSCPVGVDENCHSIAAVFRQLVGC